MVALSKKNVKNNLKTMFDIPLPPKFKNPYERG
jgi:hypothetical protein